MADAAKQTAEQAYPVKAGASDRPAAPAPQEYPVKGVAGAARRQKPSGEPRALQIGRRLAGLLRSMARHEQPRLGAEMVAIAALIEAELGPAPAGAVAGAAGDETERKEDTNG